MRRILTAECAGSAEKYSHEGTKTQRKINHAPLEVRRQFLTGHEWIRIPACAGTGRHGFFKPRKGTKKFRHGQTRHFVLAAEGIGFTGGVFQTAWPSKVLNSTQSKLLRSVQSLCPAANFVGRCEAGFCS